MDKLKCPGQDIQYWKPADIFEIPCPFCEKKIEFWKDDPIRYCPECLSGVKNPKFDLGCVDWCQHSSDCTRK